MTTRTKAKPAWRSRIVGQGEVAPSELVPNERNWRRHPKSQTDALEGALSEVGWVQQVIVNRTTGRLVDGHARVERAIARREPSVPVVYVELTEPEEALVLATLDPLGAMAEADQTALDRLLADVSVDDAALGELLAQLGSSDARSFLTDPDATPDLPATTDIERGHVFALGDHRVMCGDATNADDVARLVDGQRPRLLVTDPPYGVELHMEWRDDLMTAVAPAERSYMREAYDIDKGRRRANRGGVHGATTVSGDTRADWSEAYALVPSLEVAYVWHADRFAVPVGQGLEAIGFDHRQTIVWLKPYGVISRTHYNYRHEPCWYGVRRGATAGWLGDTRQTTVWEAASPKMMMGGRNGEEPLDHPTQKPVELMRLAVANHRGDVYEPFLGSGTTLIAAEMVGRRAFAMEIEPRYVALSIDRWQRFTGREAVRVEA